MLYVHSIVGARPVRLIEAYTFRFRGPILRLYSTFNRYPKISLAYTYNRDCTYNRDLRVLATKNTENPTFDMLCQKSQKVLG